VSNPVEPIAPGCPVRHGVPFEPPADHEGSRRFYRDVRREYGNVVPVTLEGDLPAWLVIGYREFLQLTRDTELFSPDAAEWNQWHRIADPAGWSLTTLINRELPSLYYMNGEEHRRRIAVVNGALEAVDPFELRQHTERFADQLIDSFCLQGRSDLINQYAFALPIRVVAKIFGLSDEEGLVLAGVMKDIIDSGEKAAAGNHFMVGSLRRLVAEKTAAPGDDATSWMLDRGNPEEVVWDLLPLLVGAHQPTADWIGNTLRLMLIDDRFSASLSGGRRSVTEAMNEVLWEATPAQNLPGRYATRDTRLAGRDIRKGDLLILGMAGANYDPQVRMDTSVLTGGNNAFLSFSHGESGCPFVCQEIAETIARTSIEVLLDRLPDVDLAVPESDLVWRPSPWASGLAELPVRFTPTPLSE
jgi:cytochrome P450